MKITFGASFDSIPTFEDIKIGEVFIYGGEAYMKMHESESEDNAIRLIDAQTDFFDCNDEVELCKYELIIHKMAR